MLHNNERIKQMNEQKTKTTRKRWFNEGNETEIASAGLGVIDEGRVDSREVGIKRNG